MGRPNRANRASASEAELRKFQHLGNAVLKGHLEETGFHTFLQAVARADGSVVTAQLTITYLGYVDDFCLSSDTAAGLLRVRDGAEA